jgi:hypothetical protein
MTRARRKLLLVGDSSTLCRHPFFWELLVYVERMGDNHALDNAFQDLKPEFSEIPPMVKQRGRKWGSSGLVI